MILKLGWFCACSWESVYTIRLSRLGLSTGRCHKPPFGTVSPSTHRLETVFLRIFKKKKTNTNLLRRHLFCFTASSSYNQYVPYGLGPGEIHSIAVDILSYLITSKSTQIQFEYAVFRMLGDASNDAQDLERNIGFGTRYTTLELTAARSAFKMREIRQCL